MAEEPIKQPGPDHPITIEANPARVVVSVAGRVLADTQGALTLREAGYRPVQYVPLTDVEQSLLEPTQHATFAGALLMGDTGLEPVTSALSRRRSPS